ncbi:hypothetical protein D3C78_1099400 [compost metagenome]
MQVDAHGAVVMQDAHEVAGRVVAAPALAVLHLDHHSPARGDDRRALGHGDVDGVAALAGEVAVLAVRPLAQAERPAAPRQRIPEQLRLQAWIAEGVTQFGLVLHGPGRIARRQGGKADGAAWRQDPADRRIRHPHGILRTADAQLDLDRGEQVVAHLQGFAAGVFLRLQLHLVFQMLDHAVAEHEHLRTRHGLVRVGDHAIGVGVLVDGHGRGRPHGGQQATEEDKASQHVGSGYRYATPQD